MADLQRQPSVYNRLARHVLEDAKATVGEQLIVVFQFDDIARVRQSLLTHTPVILATALRDESPAALYVLGYTRSELFATYVLPLCANENRVVRLYDA
jgi:hypothetical protein